MHNTLFSLFLLGILSLIQEHSTASLGSHDRPVVQTVYGKVQGLTVQLEDSTLVDEFRGIPYAQSPIGPLRFKKPEPPLPWTNVKDVSDNWATCLQHNVPGKGESEDCLYLDVYSPQGANRSQPLPVIVFIHGGGFTGGNKQRCNGTIMAAHGVVAVSVNYRLGPFGFMSTEDSTMPGNYGMLDQIQSLQWVQSNIAAFGGDPKSVTIFGYSAGSQSVSYLTFSPLAKGLFIRAIMGSGLGTTTSTFPPPAVGTSFKNTTLAVGNKLGCGLTPGEDFLTCLQSKNAETLFNVSSTVTGSLPLFFKFSPRVEKEFGFMPDYPLNMMYRGEFSDVDTLRGCTSQDKGNSVHDRKNDGFTVDEYRSYVTQRLQNNFRHLNSDNYIKRIEDMYIGNVTDPIEIRAKAIEMVTDLYKVAPMIVSATESRKYSPGKRHYLYQFNYQPSYAKTPAWQGVVHATDTQFDFGLPWKLTGRNQYKSLTNDDKKVAEMMVTMWTNFAKYGNPTPSGKTKKPLIHWNQFFPQTRKYLMIDAQLEMRRFNSTEDLALLDLYKDNEMEYRTMLGTETAIIGR